MAQTADDPLAEISPEERARIARASRQLAAYANFLRWCGNFPRDEVVTHPSSRRIVVLTPRQSARFAYAVEGDTLHLGVQDFEAAWMAYMPFRAAYVSDRLYLVVDPITCMGANLPALGIGITVNSPSKRAAMGKAQQLQATRIDVAEGCVSGVGSPIGQAVPITAGDAVKLLAADAKAKRKQTDISRLF